MRISASDFCSLLLLSVHVFGCSLADRNGAYSVTGDPLEAIPLSNAQVEATTTCGKGEVFRLPEDGEDRLCGGERSHGANVVAASIQHAGADRKTVRFWKSPNGLRNASLLLRLPQAYSLSVVRLRLVSPMPGWIGLSGSLNGDQLRPLQHTLKLCKDPSTSAGRELERQEGDCSNNLQTRDASIITLDLLNEHLTGELSATKSCLVEVLQISLFGHQREDFPYFAVSEVQLSGRGHCSGHSDEYCVNTDGTYICQNCQHETSGKMCEKQVHRDEVESQLRVIDSDTDIFPGYLSRLRRDTGDDNQCNATDCLNGGSCVIMAGDDVCICTEGFTGSLCETDINECIRGNHNCHSNATCANNDGSYSCMCKGGFLGSGKDCTDFNECAVTANDCHRNAACTNNVGSYSCMCKSGYSGSGMTCSDIDECTEGTHSCHGNADCTNSGGSYSCMCSSGFTGTGMTCIEIPDAPPPNIINMDSNEITLEVSNVPENASVTTFYRRSSTQLSVVVTTVMMQSKSTEKGGSVSFTLSALEANSTYIITVRICLIQHNLCGQNSTEMTASTLESAPDAAVSGEIIFPSVQEKNLTVKWSPPSSEQRNGIITQYNLTITNTLQYGLKHKPAENISIITVMAPVLVLNQTENLSEVLPGLEEDYSYTVTIKACTQQGNDLMCSPGKTSAVVRTKAAAPSGAPSDLTSPGKGSTFLHLRWSEPSFSEWNGNLTGYKILAEDLGKVHGQSINVLVAATELEANITDLHPFTKYKISVSAVNREGTGPSAKRELQTYGHVPDESVDGVVNITVNGFTAHLRWLPPRRSHRNGILSQFLVIYQRKKVLSLSLPSQELLQVTVNVSNATGDQDRVKTVTLMNLLPVSEYEVYIRACNEEGCHIGSPSMPLSVPAEAAPAVAHGSTFRIENVEERIFNLVWSPPKVNSRNGIITRYKIAVQNVLQYRFLPSDSQPVTIRDVMPGDSRHDQNETLNVQINGLEEDYTYNVSLQACTGMNDLLKCSTTVTLSQKTLPAAPVEAVSAVSVLNISEKWFTVEWAPPALEDRNGIITHYIINATNTLQYGFSIGTDTTQTVSTIFTIEETFSGQNQKQNYTISGLEEDYTYFVTMQACTTVNNHLECSAINFTEANTSSAAPELAVNGLIEGTEVRHTGFIIRWDPPLFSKRNGLITQYLVNVTNRLQYGFEVHPSLAVSKNYQVQVGANVSDQNRQLSIHVKDLEEDYSYTVTIKACTEDNMEKLECSVGNTSAEIRTLARAPMSPVSGLITISNITKIGFVIAWDPPVFAERNGVIVQYTVQVGNIRQYSFPVIDLSHIVPNRTVAVQPSLAEQNMLQNLKLDMLEEDFTYNVIIYACTNAISSLSCSNGSTPAVATTDVSAPAVGALNISFQNVHTTGFDLSWLPPPPLARNGIITHYQIRISNILQYDSDPLVPVEDVVNTTLIETDVSGQNELQTIPVDDLEEDFTYNVSIMACTGKDQCSQPTEPVILRTEPSAPLAAYSGRVIVNNVTMNSFNLIWSPPTFLDRNGIISHYIISVKNVRRYGMPVMMGNFSADRFNTTALNQSAKLTYTAFGLEEDYGYMVTMQACVDYSLCTAEQNVSQVRTDVSAPDTAVSGNIQNTSFEARALLLQWQPPLERERNGIISKYCILYQQLSYVGQPKVSPEWPFMIRIDQPWENQSAIVAGRLEGLNPASVYSIKVMACVDAKGKKLCSGDTQKNFTTDESTPSAPQNLNTVGEQQQNSIHIVWSNPIHPNGVIRQFEIMALGTSRSDNKKETFSFEIDVSSQSERHNMTLRNLLSGFNYLITVRAKTSKGLGNSSSELAARTSAGTVVHPTGTVAIPVLAPTYPPSLVKQKQISANILTWPIRRLPSSSGVIRDYRVIVVRLDATQTSLGTPDQLFPAGSLRSCNLAAQLSVGQACISQEQEAAVLFPGSTQVVVIKIGDGTTTTGRDGTNYKNLPLQANTAYTIFLRGFINPSSRRRKRNAGFYDLSVSGDYQPVLLTSSQSSGASSSSSNAGVVAGVAVTVVVILVIVIILIYMRERRKKVDVNKRNSQASTAELTPQVQGNEQKDRTWSRIRLFSTASTNKKRTQEDDLRPREPVAVSDLPRYVQEMQANDSLRISQEYEVINYLSPKMPHDVCLKPENRAKNRYANIVAYDETRVVLPELPDDPHSDYINANFLTDYEDAVQYIATQGPVPCSIIDFWRMIWENNVRTIAMVTNLEEKSRLKCNLYWPVSDGMIYGEILVEHIETVEQADFVIRTFHLSKDPELEREDEEDKEYRELKQFHFISWPDHGVPEHPIPLLNFVRRMRAYHPYNYQPKAPIVVHCSAGVGRTGTLVVIDQMLHQAKKEDKVDIFNYVLKLRFQRNFMVQTESQYIFIHDALLEALVSGNVELPVHQLPKHIHFLKDCTDGMSNCEKEFKRLRLGTKLVIPAKVAVLPANKKKNRLANALPYDRNRVKLQARPGVEGSDYINASFIDSYSTPRAFIATQGPLKMTVNDFWTMIWEQHIASVVMLTHLQERGQESSALYWPSSDTDTAAEFGHLVVKNDEETSHGEYIIRLFTITNTMEKSMRKVRQFHFLGWPERGVPSSGTSFLDLIGRVERNQQQTGNKPILVHCGSGSGRTGVYCAVSSSIDRAKLENVVDIFQTVKMMRLQRMAFVMNAEQYFFIYKTVKEYLDSFDTYANFK